MKTILTLSLALKHGYPHQLYQVNSSQFILQSNITIQHGRSDGYTVVFLLQYVMTLM